MADGTPASFVPDAPSVPASFVPDAAPAAQQSGPAAPPSPPPKPGPGFTDTVKDYWHWANDNILDKSALDTPLPDIGAGSGSIKGFFDQSNATGQQIINNEINHAHPFRAALAQGYFGIQKDVTELLSNLTTPKNVALAVGTAGNAAWAKGASMLANLYFAYRGSRDLFTAKQANETQADYIQRQAEAAAQVSLGLAGAGATTKDVVRTRIQQKLGISGDLAAKVDAKLQQEQALRQDSIKDITAVEQATASRSASVERSSGSQATSVEQASASRAASVEQGAGSQAMAAGMQQQAQQGQVSGQLANVEQQLPDRMGKVLADASQAAHIEKARVEAPFEKMAQNIQTPVTNSVTLRSTILDTLKDHGVQDAEIPSKIFASLAPAENTAVRALTANELKGSNLAQRLADQGMKPSDVRSALTNLGYVPKQIDAIMTVATGSSGASGAAVSFSDLTRVRSDLWEAANSAKDPVVKSGLFDGVNKVTVMQEDFAKANGFGPEYAKAKSDYMKFKRELGSGLMSEWLHASDVEEQAIAPKLAKLTTSQDAEALRTLLRTAGVDVSPVDQLLGERQSLVQQQKGIPRATSATMSQISSSRSTALREIESQRAGAQKEIASTRASSLKEIQSQGREAAAGIQARTEEQVKKLGENNAIVPGRSDLQYRGTSEQIRQQAMKQLYANAKQSGITNPNGYILTVYGLIRMASGSPFGALIAARGLSNVEVPQLVRSPAFQDWVIRESGVEPSNKLLIGKMRKGIAGLYPLLRRAAQSSVPARVLNQNQTVQ